MRVPLTSIRGRAAALLAAVATAGALAACGTDDPTGLGPPPGGILVDSVPVPTVEADTTPHPTLVDMLQWTSPDDSIVTVRKVIGRHGGTLVLEKADGKLKVDVPAGAVSRNTQFSITRLPGRIVAYQFEPHGTRFAVPLRVEQETRATNIDRLTHDAVVQAVYFEDKVLLDQGAATVSVREFLRTGMTLDKGRIVFDVDHFSGYGISTGRKTGIQ